VPTLKKETSQINILMMNLELVERQEQAKPQTSIWREIIKIRDEIDAPPPKKKLYKEPMKQKVDSVKRLTRSTNP
jgi:hypothetical protein